MPPSIAVAPDVKGFMKYIEALPDNEYVSDVPGLTGTWRVGDIREGMRMHALCLHSSGMGLTATWGKSNRDAFTIWMDRLMSNNELSPAVAPDKLRAYMRRIRDLFTRREEAPVLRVASGEWDLRL